MSEEKMSEDIIIENQAEELQTEAQPEELMTENQVEELQTEAQADELAANTIEAEPVSDKEQKKEAKKEKALKRRLERKERRENWKKDKKALRARKKEDLKNAPLLIRLWRLYLKVPVILLILLIFFIAVFMEDIQNVYNMYIYEKEYALWETRDNEVEDKNILYEMSPLDEEGAKRIAALPEYGKDDTWTFCVYIVGSNLEDQGEVDLSDLTLSLTEDFCEDAKKARKELAVERRKKFQNELKANYLDFPEYLYKVNKPIASSTVVTKDVVVADSEGSASEDIQEMVNGLTSDKKKFVIQTGGATRWSNSMINPNKTQRFLLTKDTFKEIDNLPLQDSCKAETVTDFLKYCNDYYKSDHMAVVFWDHGGGYKGYGSDSIFYSDMSLRDLRTAFEGAVEKNEENPAYDIIGFDACLMSTIEATHALNGYAKYYVGSEELEPGFGWDYTSFISKMCENPKMNAAQVGQAIADSYTDFYMTENYNVSELIGTQVVTMSVIDMAAAEKVYKAYCDLNKKLIKDVLVNPKTLVNISRCASKAPVYGENFYDRYNEIDLGVYMDYLSDYYPDECDAVRKELRNAVMYNRQNDYLSDSQGLSVFFPVALHDNVGLGMALLYVDEICEDKATNALLYYKIGGCLNTELTEYAKSIGCEKIRNINTSLFRKFDDSEVVIDEELNFYITLEKDLEDLIASSRLELATYDLEEGYIKYYGRDNCCELDGNGNIALDFDGRWFALDNQMLDVELTGSTDSGNSYRTRILHNDEPSYLNFAYNPETDEVSIVSIAPMPGYGNTSDADLGMKNTVELKLGDVLVPMYNASNLNTNEEYDEYGDEIKYKKNTKLEVKNLDDGNYIESIVISDTRGDNYYSPVVEFTVEGGKPSNTKLSETFYGVDD